MKTQRAQRSCAAFSSTWTSKSETGACRSGQHPNLRIHVGEEEDEKI